MSLLVVLDLDGTVANFKLRMQKAGDNPGRRNKQKFQQWLDRLQGGSLLLQDEPIVETHILANLLKNKAKLCYLTGRSERNRAVTEKWLELHKFPDVPLYMRANDDYRTARDYKEEQTQIAIDHFRHRGPVNY